MKPLTAAIRSRRPAPPRQLAKDCANVVDLLRSTRAALSSAAKLAGRTRESVMQITDEGVPLEVEIRLTPQRRLDSLYQARTWISEAENRFSQARGALDRAIERAERTML